MTIHVNIQTSVQDPPPRDVPTNLLLPTELPIRQAWRLYARRFLIFVIAALCSIIMLPVYYLALSAPATVNVALVSLIAGVLCGFLSSELYRNLRRSRTGLPRDLQKQLRERHIRRKSPDDKDDKMEVFVRNYLDLLQQEQDLVKFHTVELNIKQTEVAEIVREVLERIFAEAASREETGQGQRVSRERLTRP